MKIENAVLETLKYSNFFQYPLTSDEIHKYIPVGLKKAELDRSLRRLRDKKIIIYKNNQYTLQGYRINIQKRIDRTIISQKKIKKVKFILKIISFFPQIKLVGISGNVSVNNSEKNDDIDVFIISKPNRIWTARAICIVISSLFLKRRRKGDLIAKDKLCFNLFFSESLLKIDQKKRNLYIAHEILQMKPLFFKDEAYGHFLSENDWVLGYFPNFKFKKVKLANYKKEKINNREGFFEVFLKKIQLYFINKTKTKEIISDNQLWFFPNDFEEKIKKIL